VSFNDDAKSFSIFKMMHDLQFSFGERKFRLKNLHVEDFYFIEENCKQEHENITG